MLLQSFCIYWDCQADRHCHKKQSSVPENVLWWNASCYSVTGYTAQTKPYMAETEAQIQTAVHRVSYSITQKLWHLSGLQPISLLNTTLVPKKSACFLQHTGCDIHNSSISSCILWELSRGGQLCFRLANKFAMYLHTGLLTHSAFAEF